MNGFERHGLKHTSPSSLNMWSDDPSAWVARYLFNKKFTFGVAPMIGTLTETVVADTLCGASFEDSLEVAKKEFNRQTAIGFSEKDRERIHDIEVMALQALEVLKPYGEPEFIQKITGREQQKIELKCNGPDWSIPVIGFCDFIFRKHNLLVDLKTSLRCPSEISPSHNRQGAIYAKATGLDCKFLYCTPKKNVMHDIADVNETLVEVKEILKRQEAFLRLHDAETIRKIIPVQASSFYWTADSHIRRELYNV